MKEEKMKYEVIDNFLDEGYFNSLVALFTDKEEENNIDVPWFFCSNVSKKELAIDKLFYMAHKLYDENMPASSLYDRLIPLCEKLQVKCLLRIKANLYPNTEIVYEHPPHTDYDFSHTGALLSLNTCDGYTKLKDGTKIESVANRILLFDPSEEHCSTTTTNTKARFNINMNYIQQEER